MNVYDKYGEVVSRRFNYAQLRIDNLMNEAQSNINHAVHEANCWIWDNDSRVFGYCDCCHKELIGNSMLGRTMCDMCLLLEMGTIIYRSK